MLIRNSIEYWINVELSDSAGKSHEYDDYGDYEDSDLIVVWESGVQPLTSVQRLTFFIITIIIAVVAIVGNILVLYVNISR